MADGWWQKVGWESLKVVLGKNCTEELKRLTVIHAVVHKDRRKKVVCWLPGWTL